MNPLTVFWNIHLTGTETQMSWILIEAGKLHSLKCSIFSYMYNDIKCLRDDDDDDDDDT